MPGYVTAVASNGFYLEDPLPDTNPATSEGIFVFTESAPTVIAGQYLLVSGQVREYRPGETSGGAANLTTTEIVMPTISAGGTPPAPLPPAMRIGAGGRMPPVARIAGPAPDGDVESSAYRFDPAANAIDFYESLEGMRVVLDDAVAVGPTTSRGEIAVVADAVGSAASRNARGGVVVGPGDFHPERIILAEGLIGRGRMARVDVADRLGSVQGVLDYSYGNFKLLVSTRPVVQPGGIARQVTTLRPDASHLTIASFNVENLAATAPAAKFAGLGRAVVDNLGSPEIIALMEIQDDNGKTDDGVVSAGATLARLTAAIRAAGGPAYDSRQIDPVADQDGGEPGGNIRQVLMFDPARVAFVDRPSKTNPSTSAVTAVALDPGVRLSASPGRIAPADPAFTHSRKPLVGEFRFAGQPLFVIANHLNSKGGDSPLFGRLQPPVLASEVQRLRQVEQIAVFVGRLRQADAGARIVVLGDLNDFQFSPPLERLGRAGLVDLIETLPPRARYTYVYEGNSQAIDHILVSESLRAGAVYDVVHINAEFASQLSDHEPEVARLAFGRRP